MPQAPSTRPARRCRLCGFQRLTKILSLGNQYVSDFVTSSGEHPRSPLELVRCSECGLVQLKHTFPRASLYTHYWYRSGISETMRAALADIADKALKVAKPSIGEMVIDIGCNDGTLLRSYNESGLKLVGFEPAENLVPEASKGTDWIFNDFFSAKTFRRKFSSEKAKIITSVAMFYDLEKPNDFVNDVCECLAPNGVWIVQQNYLGTMLAKNGFDNIGHEHLEYYSMSTMEKLLNRHNLEIFDVETNDVNGGSFRTYAGYRGAFPIRKSVNQLRKREMEMRLEHGETYTGFALRIRKIKSDLYELVRKEVGRGKTVYVYGASNRGNTILQYCRLDHRLIEKATDANPEKWGRSTVGTEIPIVSKEDARRDKPNYFLVLPHHFLEEIRREEKQYLKDGGKLIVPLPKVRIVD
ncbi:MAG TPA: class I SAM-dependent methyltransferase [Candidatus Angelobacter sp.]|nr:class I SAM-dependent methyltransferase [Candidatus Angelobacter sp.]